ncbi:hypothetical protein BDZ89DRAFT_1202816 [Hymenopellis radicata]|nr:hypothetical protein BDZ89DRAFT_1202816 [Hymenopellis radicata]
MNFNPYTQGGWFNPDNQHSINNVPWSPSSPPQPCIYGALPFASEESSPETMHKFGFKYETTIVNSIVFGPNKRPFFRVANDLPRHGCTTLTNTEGTDFAVIDWGTGESQVLVEMKDVLDKQTVAAWMPLSADRSRRAMYAFGKWFSWIPKDNCICVATHGSKSPCLYAKVYRDEKLKAVILEVATQAIQIGLLEICIVATVLLQSGSNID